MATTRPRTFNLSVESSLFVEWMQFTEGDTQMSGSVPSSRSSKPVRRLVVLVALAVLMYLCMGTFRFTYHALNLAFVCLFFLLPFFAIKPALRLPRWAKITTLILLIPTLAISLLGLSAMAACDIPDAIYHVQLSRVLCTLQHSEYSVNLAWEETAGGAIGPHGVSLEQRRHILPGMYLVKSLDYFEGASEGTLSWAGADRVSLYIPIAGYYQNQKNIRREYSLKPWLYF